MQSVSRAELIIGCVVMSCTSYGMVQYQIKNMERYGGVDFYLFNWHVIQMNVDDILLPSDFMGYSSNIEVIIY